MRKNAAKKMVKNLNTFSNLNELKYKILIHFFGAQFVENIDDCETLMNSDGKFIQDNGDDDSVNYPDKIPRQNKRFC